MITFQSTRHLTLGVEIELQLVDPVTFDLTAAAPQLLALVKGEPSIKPEIFQSMAEINSGICDDVHAAEKDLRASLAIVHEACREIGVRVATTGTHPFARYSERTVFPAERYQMLIDRNQWIARRLMIFGLHVHVGMRDGDTCMRFNNFLLNFIPHLLALTASSPFWQGEETGLSSCRSTIFESCPTAGHPYRLRDWNEFSELCTGLVKSNAISSFKDLWWDLRPSPDFGTLEIRACDGPATLSETLAIVALIHALAHWYDTHGDYDTTLRTPATWMFRENKWRAARYGLDTEIIADRDASVIPLRTDILYWLDQLSPYIRELGYENHIEGILRILEKGTSSARQLAVFQNTRSLEEVVRHNTEECLLGVPIDPAAGESIKTAAKS